jgi:orotidine-5'-phosphate decarboxylase
MTHHVLPHSGHQLCVGIDPHPAILEAWGRQDTPAGLESFAQEMVNLLGESKIRLVKPQVAFFERHGVKGMGILSSVIGQLRSSGIFVIGDAKRGDIGSTMEGYATAWLSAGADFEVDALTVVPYQGLGALTPVLDLAAEKGKGVFVLAATSNPEALSIQQAIRADGLSVAAGVIRDLGEWVREHQGTEGSHGVVLGATLALDDWDFNLANTPTMPILAPGFGYQGAALSDCRKVFSASQPVLAVVARSVLQGGPGPFLSAVASAHRELSE